MKLRNLKIIGLVGVLAIALSACSLYQKATPSGQNPAQGQNAASGSTANPSGAVVIAYTDSGFTPASINAKVGQTVIFTNTTKNAVQVNSDPHPTHGLYPELNIGLINAGQSKTVTFTTAGTKTYHNHLNASQKGTVVVQ